MLGRALWARANPHEVFREDSGEGVAAKLPIFDWRFSIAD
jgi:hypothetical protein